MRAPRLRWRTFWLALGAVTILCAVLWTIAPPRYDTNDDVAIRLSLEGRSVPGEPPTGYVVLSHAALGWTLVALARLAPRVPWWDVVISGTLLWAIAALIAIAWDALGRDWLGRTASVGALLVAVLPLTIALQFTISATLAGGAAVLLLFTEATTAAPRRRAVLGMAVLLLVVATLVRPMAGIAGAGSTVLFLAPLAFGRRAAHRGVGALAAAALLAVVVYAALVSADGWLYRFDRPWQQYAQYNDMLARLFEWGGNLTGEQSAAMRAAAGWTKNDWDLLPSMWGVDSSVHGFDRLRRAYDVSASAAGGATAAVAGLAPRALTLARTDSGTLAMEAAPVIVAALIVAAASSTGGGVVGTALAAVLFLVACVAIETAFKTLPFRVIAPIQASLAAAMLITAAAHRRPSPAWLRVLAAGLVLGILVQESIGIASSVGAGLRHMQQVEDEVAALRDLHPSLIVRHADAFPAEIWWRPFHRPAYELTSVALGWNDQSPLLQDYLTKTRRQPLLRAICSDPSIVVIAARPDRLEPVTIYLQEHFGERVGWTRVNSGSFAAWRCTRAAGPSEGTDAATDHRQP